MSSYTYKPHWMLRVPVLRQLYAWKLKRFMIKTWVPKMEAALAQGIGSYHAWLEPGEPLADALAWVDTRIKAAAPDHQTQALCLVVLRCSTEEYEHERPLSEEPLAAWDGYAGQWWRGGRLQIERTLAALPEHHGLLFLFTDTMEAFRSTYLPPTPPS